MAEQYLPSVATYAKLQPANTTVIIDFDLKIRFFLYFAFGLILCILNTVCIIVFSSSKELCTKYALFNALSIADFLNGLSIVLAGTFRNIYMYSGEFFVEVTKMDCLFRTPFGLLLVIAGQFPALLHLFLAADRVMALHFPVWYRESPIFIRKHFLITVAVLVNIVFIVVAGLNNALNHGVNANRMCAVMNSTGITYGTLHYSLIGFAYLLCLISLWAIFRKFNRKMKPSSSELRRQRMVLALDAVSVLLVSIPNVVLILQEWGTLTMNELVVGIIYLLYGAHSGAPFFIYMYFRPDFRARFYQIFGRPMRAISDRSTVHVASLTQGPRDRPMIKVVG